MNRSVVRIPVVSVTIAFALCAGGSALAADCAPPTLVNSLAMETAPGGDIPTVTATIQGHPEKLMVGIADATQLWNATAKTLGLPVWEGARVMDGGGRFSEDDSRAESLTLGSMETGYFHTFVTADPDFGTSGTAGILGTDMMMRFDIDLDFAHHRLNYFSPEQCDGAGIRWAPSKVTSVKMAAYANVVFVPVILDGKTIVAALDTTADRTFLNPQIAKKLFGLTPDLQETGTVRDSGALLKAGLHRFSSLAFGGLSFNDPQIAIPFDTLSQSTREFHASRIIADRYPLSQFLPDMVIGMDVLKQTHLYVSFRDQKIYVSAAGDGSVLNAAPVKTSWFNQWRFGYDTYLYPLHRPFFGL